MFSHSYCILKSSIIFAFHSSDLKVTIHTISIHFKTHTFNHPKCHKDPLLSSHKHHSQNTKSSHHFLKSQSPTLTQPPFSHITKSHSHTASISPLHIPNVQPQCLQFLSCTQQQFFPHFLTHTAHQTSNMAHFLASAPTPIV